MMVHADLKKGVTLCDFMDTALNNIADGVERPTRPQNHSIEMVSAVRPANRHTIEHTKSTLLVTS